MAAAGEAGVWVPPCGVHMGTVRGLVIWPPDPAGSAFPKPLRTPVPRYAVLATSPAAHAGLMHYKAATEELGRGVGYARYLHGHPP